MLDVISEVTLKEIKSQEIHISSSWNAVIPTTNSKCTKIF